MLLLAAALGIAGAGAAKLGQTIGRKMSEKKKNKKMGGGMMKKYSKGGDSKYGKKELKEQLSNQKNNLWEFLVIQKQLRKNFMI